MNKRKVDRVLKLAAKYIEDNGWCQSESENSEGNVCAVGAIMKVVDHHYGYENSWLVSASTRKILDYLSERGTSYNMVERWNDRKSNRKGNVIKVMKNAAKWKRR